MWVENTSQPNKDFTKIQKGDSDESYFFEADAKYTEK